MAFERDEDDEDPSDVEESTNDDYSIADLLTEWDDGPPRPPEGAHLTPESKRQQAEYWAAREAADRLADEAPRTRGKKKDYDGNGITTKRMCHTETTLRACTALICSPLIRGPNVYARLGGAEVRRRDGVNFPVKKHLARWGFSKEPNNEKYRDHWGGFYTHTRTGRKLLLNDHKYFGPHIMAFFVTGERLIVHCSAGNLSNTSSNTETQDLNRTIGRALTWTHTKPGDVIAVCCPRTEAYRTLSALKSTALQVNGVRLLFLQVDRGGGFSGMPGQQ